jgi:4-carboxymuconolactone decarboxylase
MAPERVTGPWDELMPRFSELTNDVFFAEIWERPALSKRERSILAVSALTALYRTEQLRGNLRRALRHGLTKDELAEAIMHVGFYGGWPVAVNAYQVLKEVLEES